MYHDVGSVSDCKPFTGILQIFEVENRLKATPTWKSIDLANRVRTNGRGREKTNVIALVCSYIVGIFHSFNSSFPFHWSTNTFRNS